MGVKSGYFGSFFLENGQELAGRNNTRRVGTIVCLGSDQLFQQLVDWNVADGAWRNNCLGRVLDGWQ